MKEDVLSIEIPEEMFPLERMLKIVISIAIIFCLVLVAIFYFFVLTQDSSAPDFQVQDIGAEVIGKMWATRFELSFTLENNGTRMANNVHGYVRALFKTRWITVPWYPSIASSKQDLVMNETISCYAPFNDYDYSPSSNEVTIVVECDEGITREFTVSLLS